MPQSKQLEFIDHLIVPSINGFNAICDLRVYQNERGQIVVIVSELITPEGDYIECVSVTNAAEDIATIVRNGLGYNFDFWIEHYPPRGRYNRTKESFSLVTFDYDPGWWRGLGGRLRDYRNPRWQHILREWVEQLVEQDLDLPEPKI